MSESESVFRPRIGDILDVPTIRTVVSLEDRQDGAVRADLVAAFVPT